MVGGMGKKRPIEKRSIESKPVPDELGRRFCDYIIHGGAPLVLAQGKGFETSLIEKMQKITGVPCTTSIVAAMDAFRDLSVTRLAAVVPYPPELNAENDQLSQRVGLRSGFIGKSWNHFHRIECRIGRRYLSGGQASRQRSRKSRRTFLYPVPIFPSWMSSKTIETDLGLPVIANTTSQLHAAFKAIGMKEKISGYGRLMRLL